MLATKSHESDKSKTGSAPDKTKGEQQQTPAPEIKLNPLWSNLATHVSSRAATSGGPPPIQRMCAECEQEMNSGNPPDMQMALGNGSTPTTSSIQRQLNDPEEDQAELPVQAKLTIGAPDDEYEQEADRVADAVMRMPELTTSREEETKVQAKPIANQITPLVRRIPENEVEEEPVVQSMSELESSGDDEESVVTQRMSYTETEEDEIAQAKSVVSNKIASIHTSIQTKGGNTHKSQVSASMSANINAMKGGGNPLPRPTRAFFEQRFGADFSHVRIHTDSRAVETAKSINAKAFTAGENIAFGEGQFAPESKEGKKLLGHELTHVLQQHSRESFKTASLQRDEAIHDTGEAARKVVMGSTGQTVRKAGRISREQYLRKEPDPRKGENVLSTLAFNTSVFVYAAGGNNNGWYQIVTDKGQEGWVPTVAVALDPPEPSAELYKVKSGDTAIDLVGRWYGPPGGFKRWWWPGSDDAGDARFYVSALAYANKGRAGMSSPNDLTERSAWKQVRVIKGLTIWRPSKAFLQALKGKVSSGSITKELWEDVKKVAKAIWEFVVFAAAFIAGLLYGAGESIYDLFAGVVDLVKIAWSIGKSIFTGNIISDAKQFWEDLKQIDVSRMAKDFQDKWFATDPWDAGFFQGRVLGYVIMEIIMLVASGGILTALKWGGKFAKIGSLIAKLPRVAKLIEAVKGSKITTKIGKLSSKAAKLEKRIPGKKLLLVFRRAKKVKKLGAVSLKRLRNILGRAGVSPRPYKLQKVAKAELKALREAGADVDNIYGWVARDGAGNIITDLRGRPIINFTPKGLSSLEEAVKTFGHEVKHIKDFAAGLKTSSEALAELAGEQLWLVVKKSLKTKKR